jgi:hypothetical protein
MMLAAEDEELPRIGVNMLAAPPRAVTGPEVRGNDDSLRGRQRFVILGRIIADHPLNRSDFIKKDGGKNAESNQCG